MSDINLIKALGEEFKKAGLAISYDATLKSEPRIEGVIIKEPSKLTLEALKNVNALHHISRGRQWLQGDLHRHGETLGDEIYQFLPVEDKTILNYAWVCSRFHTIKPSELSPKQITRLLDRGEYYYNGVHLGHMRRPLEAKFGHHSELAGFLLKSGNEYDSLCKRAELLDRAIREGMSIADLRALVRSYKKGDPSREFELKRGERMITVNELLKLGLVAAEEIEKYTGINSEELINLSFRVLLPYTPREALASAELTGEGINTAIDEIIERAGKQVDSLTGEIYE